MEVTQEQLEQALQIVGKVCAERQGTLAEHQAIQQAFGIVVNAVRDKPKAETNGQSPLALAEEIIEES